jgi:hypothetical protein
VQRPAQAAPLLASESAGWCHCKDGLLRLCPAAHNLDVGVLRPARVHRAGRIIVCAAKMKCFASHKHLPRPCTLHAPNQQGASSAVHPKPMISATHPGDSLLHG